MSERDGSGEGVAPTDQRGSQESLAGSGGQTRDRDGWSLSRKLIAGLGLLTVASVVLPGFVPAENVAGEAIGMMEGGEPTLSGFETQHSFILGFLGGVVSLVMWFYPRGKWLITALLTTIAANMGSLSVELLQSTDPTTRVALLSGSEVPVAAYEPGLALYVGTGLTGIVAITAWVLAGKSTIEWGRAKAT